MTPVLVLVGPPGAGKTVVGELLAKRRGVDFRDTDRDIEATAGATITEIFVDAGEARFRELEREAVRRALDEHEGVLALGGGAVISAETRTLLAGHRVAFLDVSLAPAAERVGLNRSRPLLAVNPRATLTRLLGERRPFYEEVATITVTTDDRTPEEVADAVDAALGAT
jgi:shikimate kinase